MEFVSYPSWAGSAGRLVQVEIGMTGAGPALYCRKAELERLKTMPNPICPIATIPERRRAPRAPYHTPIHYANAGAKGAGIVKDISSEGMFMETRGPLQVGDRIRIDFLFRNSRHPMDLEGQIARKAPDGVGVWFVWS